jgi:hypothetical protein
MGYNARNDEIRDKHHADAAQVGSLFNLLKSQTVIAAHRVLKSAIACSRVAEYP